MILNEKFIALHEQKYESLKKSVIEKSLSNIRNAPTEEQSTGQKRPLTIDELKASFESSVMKSLSVLDNKIDFYSVKSVTEKFVDQITHFRNRFREEPSGKDKVDFFLRARYELERTPVLSDIIKREAKLLNPATASITQKLDRMLSIDSKLAKRMSKGDIYYKAPPFKEVIGLFKEGEQKIESLTKDLMHKDMGFIKANFIATEVVKHEERHDVRMPLKQREALNQVGDYVSNNFQTLVKSGLSEAEAKIVYIEGAKLAASYNNQSHEIAVNETQLKQIQQESKNLHSIGSTNIQKTESVIRLNKTDQKTTTRSKSLELEI